MRKVVDTVTFVPRVLKFETREKLALASNARFDPFSLRVSFLTSFSFFSRFRKRDARNNVGGRGPPWREEERERCFLPEFYELFPRFDEWRMITAR